MNGVIIQFFHWYYPKDGSLWKHFSEKAETLKKMGFTAAWLPPAYKCSQGKDGTGYDCYDLYDLGEFDQKGSVRTAFGTRQEYLDAVNTAQQKGLSVYADIVLNHRMGADGTELVNLQEVNPDNRLEPVGEPFEGMAPTLYQFPSRNGQYSSFIWNYQCFSGIDKVQPTGIAEEREGIFKILNDKGNVWAEDVGIQFGNFDYVMGADVEFRNEGVREEMKNWIAWYLSTCPLDGLRLDALKHISADFQKEWIDAARSVSQNELFMVGEFWTQKYELLVPFLEGMENRLSLFDCPLHYHFFEASQQRQDYDLTKIMDQTLSQSHPANSVSFVENHDTQPFQALESSVEPWFKPLAYAIILLIEEGYPCVFYVDLYGATYEEKDGDGNIQRVAMPAIETLPKLLEARSLFAYGVQVNYFNHANCIAWIREGDGEHSGCIVVISNGEEGSKEITLDSRYSNSIFYDFLGYRKEEIQVDGGGKGRFTVNGRSVSVWVKK